MTAQLREAVRFRAACEATFRSGLDPALAFGRFYVAHVLGSCVHGTAAVTGDRGTVLNVEFFTGQEGESGQRGVAKDNKGNIYKVVL